MRQVCVLAARRLKQQGLTRGWRAWSVFRDGRKWRRRLLEGAPCTHTSMYICTCRRVARSSLHTSPHIIRCARPPTRHRHRGSPDVIHYAMHRRRGSPDAIHYAMHRRCGSPDAAASLAVPHALAAAVAGRGTHQRAARGPNRPLAAPGTHGACTTAHALGMACTCPAHTMHKRYMHTRYTCGAHAVHTRCASRKCRRSCATYYDRTCYEGGAALLAMAVLYLL